MGALLDHILVKKFPFIINIIQHISTASLAVLFKYVKVTWAVTVEYTCGPVISI